MARGPKCAGASRVVERQRVDVVKESSEAHERKFALGVCGVVLVVMSFAAGAMWGARRASDFVAVAVSDEPPVEGEDVIAIVNRLGPPLYVVMKEGWMRCLWRVRRKDASGALGYSVDVVGGKVTRVTCR